MQAKKYRMTKHIENNAFEAHDQEKRQNVRFENEKKKKNITFFYQFCQWHESPTYFMFSVSLFATKKFFLFLINCNTF